MRDNKSRTGFEIHKEGNSSLDEKLIAISYMDIFKLLQENVSINKILLQALEVAVSASQWFVDYSQNKRYKSLISEGLVTIDK